MISLVIYKVDLEYINILLESCTFYEKSKYFNQFSCTGNYDIFTPLE